MYLLAFIFCEDWKQESSAICLEELQEERCSKSRPKGGVLNSPAEEIASLRSKKESTEWGFPWDLRKHYIALRDIMGHTELAPSVPDFKPRVGKTVL